MPEKITVEVVVDAPPQKAWDGFTKPDSIVKTYAEVAPLQRLKYVMGKDEGRREVVVAFKAEGGKTRVSETFDAESTFSLEQQRSGWQSILDNYKKHVEGR